MSIVLASILLSVTVFAQVGPSQSGQGSDDAMMRQLVQYFMRVGTEQYERGYYIEAEKTFQMAQGYGEFLEPLERRKLESMLEKAGLAAIERKHALEAKQAGEQLLGSGQAAAARESLLEVKDSEFLTERERADIGASLRQISAASAEARGPVRASGAREDAAAETRDGEALERFKTRIADLYYESVKAYHAGDFDTARAGFTRALDSGLMPAPMVQTIQGYLEDMEGTPPDGRSDPQVTMSRSSSDAPSLTIGDVVGMPAAYPTANAAASSPPQSERQRIEQLYNRSWEFYAEGELDAAREGFVEVAESGLFTAPEGRRPEDYIATIDRLREVSADMGSAPQRRSVSQPGAEETDAGQGGFIEVINRRRNIIRSHTQAVVNDAIDRAHTHMAQAEFEKAREPIDEAQRLINQNQLHLGDDLYKQHNRRLRDVLEAIAEAEEARDRQLAEQKRLEAAEEQRRLRDQAETDRQQRIDELMSRAKAYWKQQRYEAALGQIESLLVIDPLHDDALTLKQQLEDMIYMRRQVALDKEYDEQRAQILMDTAESQIPYADEVTYPKNWREISARRKPDEPIGLDPESMQTYQQLDTIVDLSMLSPEMPLSEAVDIIRNSVEPPLSIIVLWRDLYENAEVEPTTTIDMEGLRNVKLSIALENLTRAVTPVMAFAPVEYVVNRGVVTIGTEEGLPTQQLVTRVYDVSDLVGEPANYGGMQGLMMGQMMGQMMGGMGGGMMGGGMGGMGGGMMGGGMMGGGGGMMSVMIAQNLRQLIQESIDPLSWYELSDLGEGTIMVYPQQQPKKLAIYQTPEVHQRIETLLDELRRALGHQVSIEARFLVVSENFLEDVGLDLDFSYNFGGKWGLVTVAQESALTGAPDASTGIPGSLGGLVDTPAATVTGGYGSVLDDLQVTLLLRATQARTDSKSLAAPKVTVLSGESASFSINDTVSYAIPPDVTQTTAVGGVAGTTQQQGVYQNIGMLFVGSNLSISPTITKDKKNVLLNIMTVQNDLLRFRTHQVEALVDTGDGVDGGTDVVPYSVSVPETETSSVMTRVSVPDGGTLLLGGHKLTAEVDTEVGVPVLSKIPVLGRLFSNRGKIRDNKILLILVKPTIILQEEREEDALAALEAGILNEFQY